MLIAEIIKCLDAFAHPSLQESYDNCGLLTGNAGWECSGILCTLDVTEAVVAEAKERRCNCIVAHHPIIFGGIKQLTGSNYVQRTVIAAVKNDIAIYAIHTNLDNVMDGVNKKMAEKLGLTRCKPLLQKRNILKKLYYFTPVSYAEAVRQALFDAGGGNIGNYSECSFNTGGKGTYKANENANPFTGSAGVRHEEEELRTEIIFPAHLQNKLVTALLLAHPYEEVAYDIVALENEHPGAGSGMTGELSAPVDEVLFLQQLKAAFGLKLVRHTPLRKKQVQRVALCGGTGSFLIRAARSAGADVFVTSDVKYHEFFDAENQLVIADIGHWESEQFTIDLLFDILTSKFPTFAVLKSGVVTNPVHYFI